MNKKTFKEWWTERSQNQKILLITGVILFAGIIGGDKSKTKNSTNNSYRYEQPSRNAKFCPVCYREFSHQGYRNIGTRTYCSLKCYVDGDGK
jgi:hypothetical protein